MRFGIGVAALGLWAVLATTVFAQATATDKPDAKRAELEKKFAESLSGVELVGTFTTDGKEDKTPKEDRYTLISVSKLDGDMWLFTAKMKHGDKDVTIPMPLPVKWAGDTPVITMTETTIPGLGTFTCRVLFYEDHYVGYWRHGEVRGGMSGRIEKIAPATDKPNADKAAPKPRSE